MSYRSLARANERYQLTVMWLLMAAFLVAMVMMFVHPTVTLALFWLGLLCVGAFAVSERFITAALERSARQSLVRHSCPCCGSVVRQDPSGEDDWYCQECGAAFTDAGRRDH